MGQSLYENIVFVFCIVLALAGFVYYMFQKHVQERKLKQSEFVAELDILSKKISEMQEQRKNHV